MLKLVFGLSALMVIAAPAAAQQSTGKPQDPTKTDAAKIICKKEDTIGSRLGAKKVCLTVQEWADLAAANREHTQDIQKDSGITPSN